MESSSLGPLPHPSGFPPSERQTRPEEATSLIRMLQTLKSTFESLSNLKGAEGNYDPLTKKFSAIRGAGDQAADKVSEMGKSLVSGFSEMVYFDDGTMQQGFNEIEKELDDIKNRLCDPSVKFEYREIQKLETSFIECFKAYEDAVGKVLKIQKKANFENNEILSNHTKQVLSKVEETGLVLLEKFMERKLALYRELLDEMPDLDIAMIIENDQLPTVDRDVQTMKSELEKGITFDFYIGLSASSARPDFQSKYGKLYDEYLNLERFEQNKYAVPQKLLALMHCVRDLKRLPKEDLQAIRTGSFEFLTILGHLSETVKEVSEQKEKLSPNYLEKIEQVEQRITTQFLQFNQDLMNSILQSFQSLNFNSSSQPLEKTFSSFKALTKAFDSSKQQLEKTCSDFNEFSKIFDDIISKAVESDDFRSLTDYLRGSKSSWEVDCSLERMQFRVNELKGNLFLTNHDISPFDDFDLEFTEYPPKDLLKAIFEDPDAIKKDLDIVRLFKYITDKDFIKNQALCQSSPLLEGTRKQRLNDLVAYSYEARASLAVLNIVATMDLIQRTTDALLTNKMYLFKGHSYYSMAENVVDYLQRTYDQSKEVSNLSQFLQEFLDTLPKEEETHKRIKDLIELFSRSLKRIDSFLKDGGIDALEEGKKIIQREYGQPSDGVLDAIETLVGKIEQKNGDSLSIEDQLLLKGCVKKSGDLSFEINDSAKIDAFYAHKKRILKRILKIQEKELFGDDAQLTSKALDDLAEAKKIDKLDKAKLKDNGLVVFEVDGQFFKIDKKTLIERSQVMKKMIEGTFKDGIDDVVSLKEINPADFQCFVDYINWMANPDRQKPKFDDPNTYVSLWHLGERFDVMKLKELSVEMIQSLSDFDDQFPLFADGPLFEDLLKNSSKKTLREWISRLNAHLMGQIGKSDADVKELEILATRIAFAKKLLADAKQNK